MKIETVKIKDIKPYERNARRHQEKDVAAIKASIEAFGFNDPIGIWSDENVIVEGHGRLEAAKELGMTEVPCIRLDNLTDAQRRAYALAHNKTAELSEWDDELLDLELDELAELDDIDMADFGFELSDGGDETLEASDDNYTGTVPDEPKAKVGDLWQLGRWVYCKQCGKKHFIS